VYESWTIASVNKMEFSLPLILLSYLLHAGLFYANSDWALPRLAGRRHYWTYGVAVLALTSLYALLRAKLNVGPLGPALP